MRHEIETRFENVRGHEREVIYFPTGSELDRQAPRGAVVAREAIDNVLEWMLNPEGGGMTQARIEREAGLGRGTISRWRNRHKNFGRGGISRGTWIRLRFTWPELFQGSWP